MCLIFICSSMSMRDCRILCLSYDTYIIFTTQSILNACTHVCVVYMHHHLQIIYVCMYVHIHLHKHARAYIYIHVRAHMHVRTYRINVSVSKVRFDFLYSIAFSDNKSFFVFFDNNIMLMKDHKQRLRLLV